MVVTVAGYLAVAGAVLVAVNKIIVPGEEFRLMREKVPRFWRAFL
jgi:hypothetical protein